MNFTKSSECLAQLFEGSNLTQEKCESLMTKFCIRFDEILKKCPDFLDIQVENSEDAIHPNEDIIHSLLNIVGLHIATRIHLGTEIYCYNQKRCDILMTKKSREIAVIIEVKFNKTTAEALDQIIDKQYIKGLPNSVDFQNRILIGLNVTKNKKSEFELMVE